MERKYDIIISGDSMYPFLQNGEKVKAQTVDPGTVTIGDVIVYKKHKDHLTAHRVIEIMNLKERKMYFVTKGDNNPSKDDYIVHPHQIVGRVVKMNKADWNTEIKLILSLIVKLINDIYRGESVLNDVNKSDICWNELHEHLCVHGIVLFVMKHIVGYQVPKTSLRQHIMYKMIHNQINSAYFHELKKIMTEVDFRSFYLVKGFVLGELIYDDIFLRELSDLDILVKDSEICDLFYTLHDKLGYSMLSSDINEEYIDYPAYLREDIFYEMKCCKKVSSLFNSVVELKKATFAIDETRISRFMETESYCTFGGITVKTFDLEHNFVHTCMNLYMDHNTEFGVTEGYRLKDVVDVLFFYKKYKDTLDWSYVYRIIDECNMLYRMSYVVKAIEHLFGEIFTERIRRDYANYSYNGDRLPNPSRRIHDWKLDIFTRIFDRNARYDEFQKMQKTMLYTEIESAAIELFTSVNSTTFSLFCVDTPHTQTFQYRMSLKENTLQIHVDYLVCSDISEYFLEFEFVNDNVNIPRIKSNILIPLNAEKECVSNELNIVHVERAYEKSCCITVVTLSLDSFSMIDHDWTKSGILYSLYYRKAIGRTGYKYYGYKFGHNRFALIKE